MGQPVTLTPSLPPPSNDTDAAALQKTADQVRNVVAEFFYYLAGAMVVGGMAFLLKNFYQRNISFLPAFSMLGGCVMANVGNMFLIQGQKDGVTNFPSFWGPSKPFEPGQPIPVDNAGNTCFISAAIQGIMADPRICTIVKTICQKEIARHSEFLSFLQDANPSFIQRIASPGKNNPAGISMAHLLVVLMRRASNFGRIPGFEAKYPHLTQAFSQYIRAKNEHEFPQLDEPVLSVELKSLRQDPSVKPLLEEYAPIIRREQEGFRAFLKLIESYEKAEREEPHEVTTGRWPYTSWIDKIRLLHGTSEGTQEDPEDLLRCLTKYIFPNEYPDLYFSQAIEKTWAPYVYQPGDNQEELEAELQRKLTSQNPNERLTEVNKPLSFERDCVIRIDCLGDDGQQLINQLLQGRDNPSIPKNSRASFLNQGIPGYYYHASDRLHLGSFPKSLLVHLKRYMRQGSEIIKDDRVVNMPEELLLQDKKYRLRTVIIQNGSYHGGHYINYVLRNNKWWYTSDNLVSVVDHAIVAEALTKGYLYFYEMIEIS